MFSAPIIVGEKRSLKPGFINAVITLNPLSLSFPIFESLSHRIFLSSCPIDAASLSCRFYRRIKLYLHTPAITVYFPFIANGTSAAWLLAAILAAPGLNGMTVSFVRLKLPSGKMPMIPPASSTF